MDSYTPISLPYFAPADELPARLPTLEEVLACTNLLQGFTNSRQTKIVRIGESFVAKYGKEVKSIEGENMLFVKQHTTIPIPQLYAMYTFGEGETMLIMEFIEGLPLRQCCKSITEPERLEAIAERLRAQVNELRQIPAPGYYGAIGRRPFTDLYRGCEYGPFDDFSDLVRTVFDLAFSSRTSELLIDIKEHYAETLDFVATKLNHRYPVFSHGDLHSRNIIVRPDGEPVIIDYELAGFHPAFFEYTTSEKFGPEMDFLDEKFTNEEEILKDAADALEESTEGESSEEESSEDESSEDELSEDELA
ncbi:hypothetical protein ONZ43_g4041 [Nemania bipapillata]|uniref:Uncharacterized protein n=1 Tax=Nemania bipapillata TaxID=110536 RepID=A0ACC2ISP3_9PEZI|nr:hypothetical protein ONZ43_g4041 [Nemania bipapillata]